MKIGTRSRTASAPVSLPPNDPGAGLSKRRRNAIDAAVDQFGKLPGALLPVLHEVQTRLGYIPKQTVPLIAHRLNLSRADVHGVISFYHFFRTQKSGNRVVYICRAEACQANGGRRLEKHAQKKLGVGFHETTPDGRYTLEPVYCLGNCACGPAMMVDEQPHARVTAKRFNRILDLDGDKK